MIAVGFGSKYLEKHITFNRLKKGVDYYSSVEPSSFKKFVRIVKYNAKSILTKSDLSKEYEYRKETKKMLILNKNKKRGQCIGLNDISYKRCETTCLEPLDISFLKNKKLVLNLKKNSVLKKKHFKNRIIISVVARTGSRRLPKKLC